MQCAERKAAAGQGLVQPWIREGQHGGRPAIVEIVAFDGADLHPERVQNAGNRRPGTPVRSSVLSHRGLRPGAFFGTAI